MRRLALRLSGVGAAVAALALSVPGAAFAENEVTIDHVESTGSEVNLLLSVDRLPGGAGVEADSVDVAVDGRAVDSVVKTVAAGDIQRSTMLVLDASNSMRRAGKFDAAKAAVDAYLTAAPEDVRIGLVAFAGKVSTTIDPTTDHDAVAAALEGVTLKRGTSVYDGIEAGMAALGDEGSRSVLVLSDGADTGSTTTLDVLSRQAADAGVVVDVVSLAEAARAAELASLADATRGTVIPADRAALATVFSRQADALAEQLLITFEAPRDVTTDASVDVTLTSAGQTFHDSALVAFAGTGTQLDVVDSGKALVSRPVMLVGALALAVGLGGVLVTVLVGATDSRTASERRLDEYFGDGRESRRRGQAATADLKGSAVAVADKVVTADLETRISQRLTGAGSALTAAEWVLLHAAIAVGGALVGFLVGGAATAVLGLVLGIVLPWIYLRFRHKRRLSKFNANLAQSLGLMAGGLQAGLSLPQAVDTVVREGNEPIAGEFKRALIEQRLGIDITDAMEGIGQRMESQDFTWVVMAIRIQREVGGNLAEILHTVSDTLREREYLRRQVKALSAEGRMSAWILGALPVGMFGYMLMANRKYVEPLYTTGLGWIMLIVAALFLSVGSFFMAKLAKVEV
ncbi:type II secretion system F family protein [Nocardioides sp. zg-1230]|uniref:type II secretion system F family protein n=1 Tax=Nocardioides sp. zg-1230 TaxID=2736601 RepID=UPI0015563F7A|nr:type II secretion system F family protein [Nocardioides sp. zg-1230]NPC43541.1 VWA domain-containing protein [Nocardioides sp. zg-1230]